MIKADRYHVCEWDANWNSVRVPLENDHFDQSDLKFVRTAMASESKHLVAEEHGFYKKDVPRTLKQKAKIKLQNSEDALEGIIANL